MKQILKRALSVSLLLSSAGAFADDCNSNCNDVCENYCGPRTSLLLRSQGANTARELVGWQYEINKPEMCDFYGATYLAVEYTKTFRASGLAQSLFGTDTLLFQGSDVAGTRNPLALIAENFGLARNYSGSITFAPSVQNVIVDFGFYLGLDEWTQGLYFRAHLPFAYTNWNILGDDCNNDCNTNCNTSCNLNTTLNSTNCSVGIVDITRGNTTYTQGFVSNTAGNATADGLRTALQGKFQYGDMKYAWNYGGFRFCDQTAGGLADIDLILGYNFVNNDCYRFGLYVQAVMPTGTRPDGQFVFQPVIGNGKHFELGGGISAMATLWQCDQSALGLFLEGNVTHMFNDNQCRLFDFNDTQSFGGPLSRYLLLKGFVADTTTSNNGYLYNGELQNAVNINMRNVAVSVGVKGDASLKLAYRNCGFGFDIGWNIYGQSQETLSFCNSSNNVNCNNNSNCNDNNNNCASCVKSSATSLLWGVKGVEDVYSPALGLVTRGATTVVGGQQQAGDALVCPAADATFGFVLPGNGNSFASVYSVKNNNDRSDAKIYTAGAVQSINAQLATTDCLSAFSTSGTAVSTTVSELVPTIAAQAYPSTNQVTTIIRTDANPTYVNATSSANLKLIDPLKNDNLNICSGAAPAILTQKVFGHINYVWEDECGWNPHIGFGAEAEFSGCNNKYDSPFSNTANTTTTTTTDCNTNCDNNNCRTNYNVWGVWFKGGFSF